MNKSERYHAKWNKPVTKGKVLNASTYINKVSLIHWSRKYSNDYERTEISRDSLNICNICKSLLMLIGLPMHNMELYTQNTVNAILIILMKQSIKNHNVIKENVH